MNMDLIVQTAATAEPVSLALVKDHLRISSTDDDALIEAVLIPSARNAIEAFLSRALITRTYRGYLDTFPTDSAIKVLRPPLSSVTHVKYYDSTGVQQTLSTSVYQVDTIKQPGRIGLKSGQTWPDTEEDKFNAVEIEFVAGYGANATTVPAPIVQGVLMTVGHFYEYKEMYAAQKDIAAFDVPEVVMWMLEPFRIYAFE